MRSMLLVFGAYVAAKSLFVGAPLYDRLAWIMPVEWWANAVGMVLTLGVLWAIVAYRLNCESLSWEDAGWSAPALPRELAWGGACAAAVLAVGELLLTSTSNSASVERWRAVVDSGLVGKILALISIGLLTGIMEELVYRGALFAFTRRRWGRELRGRTAFVAASAVFFAAMHGLSGWADYLVYALIGALFAGTLAASSSLRAVMLAHVLVNSAHVVGWGRYLRLPSLR